MKLFEEKPKTVGKIILVPIAQISPSPHQPRRSFDPEGLDTLAKSIAQNGLLVPVSLRADEEGYTLIAGERRLRACQSLGMSEIPAMVLKKDEEDAAVLTLIENLHRENLDCFEEAMGILRVMQMGGISQAKVCAMLGKSQPAVANKLRLLRLPPEVRKTCRELRLGERICRALLPARPRSMCPTLPSAPAPPEKNRPPAPCGTAASSFPRWTAPSRKSGVWAFR
mgnify:CR=1 FL=1